MDAVGLAIGRTVSGTDEVMSVSSMAAGLATLQAGYNASPIASDTPGLRVLVSQGDDPGGGHVRGSKVDLVFIHGFNGGNWSSWTSKNGFNWLVESIPKVGCLPGARVLSYGYPGLDIESAAEELNASLIQDRASHPEHSNNAITFVCLNTGGLVAKQAFLSSRSVTDERASIHLIHKSIKGFIFFGMEHYTGQENETIRALAMLPPVMRMARMTGAADFDRLQKIIPRVNHDFAAWDGEKLPIVSMYQQEVVRTFPFAATRSQARVLFPKSTSSLEYPWAMNRPSTRSPNSMARFDSEAEDDCSKALHALLYVVDQIEHPELSSAPGLKRPFPPTPPPPQITSAITAAVERTCSAETGGLRLLSLDGGGIRGLFGVIVLEAVMEEVRKIDCPDSPDPLRPCDYFDYIGGTSTGGLLAIMLGRLRMDLASCKIAYKTLARDIFQKSWLRLPGKYYWDAWRGNPWFSGEPLEKAVRDLVEVRLTPKEREMLKVQHIEPREARLGSRQDTDCKTFVVAVRYKDEQPRLFRTYDSRDGEAPNCTIWEACRATSAAPLYFPPIQIAGHTYCDGGAKANNPISEVYREATREQPDRAIRSIVSIGTGKPKQLDPGHNAWAIAKYALDMMTNTQTAHLNFRDLLRVGPRAGDAEADADSIYTRLNEETGALAAIDMADTAMLGRVEDLAEAFLETHRTEIVKCARGLAKTIRGK